MIQVEVTLSEYVQFEVAMALLVAILAGSYWLLFLRPVRRARPTGSGRPTEDYPRGQEVIRLASLGAS